MTINEMIKNVKALNIPGLEVTLSMSVDEINKAVRNVMFERFVSAVAAYSASFGISAPNSRKFAIDFIQSDDYVKNCITATINLVLNGGFYNRMALDGFINRLLWSPVYEAVHEKLDRYPNYNRFLSMSEAERVELQKHAIKQAMMNWNE